MSKIAICTVQVPFIRGGAEYLAESLKTELLRRGYETDIISMPFKWYPPDQIIDNSMMWRGIDLTEVNGTPIDTVICLKFPAYLVRHPHKILWLLHQHRQAYDLWDTEYGDLHQTTEGRRVRELIVGGDNRYLMEAKKLFTISKTVTERLLRFNGVRATTLYPPPAFLDRFYQGAQGDYLYYPSRIDRMKRQKLLIEALACTKTPVRVVISGAGSEAYRKELISVIEEKRLKERVKISGMVTEEEKIRLYADSLGVYFGAYNEDYGYVPLEGFFSGKPVITHTDSGGALEFVDENNGFITEPEPGALAEAIDSLYMNREKAREKGMKGLQLMKDLRMDWDHVVGELLG